MQYLLERTACKQNIEKLCHGGYSHFVYYDFSAPSSSLLDSKEFYDLLVNGSYISYDNRVYLGGPCNAGKTSLACIFTGDEVPGTWISTNGLQIYFGRNGIHLKDKKMIPIRKG